MKEYYIDVKITFVNGNSLIFKNMIEPYFSIALSSNQSWLSLDSSNMISMINKAGITHVEIKNRREKKD